MRIKGFCRTTLKEPSSSQWTLLRLWALSKTARARRKAMAETWPHRAAHHLDTAQMLDHSAVTSWTSLAKARSATIMCRYLSSLMPLRNNSSRASSRLRLSRCRTIKWGTHRLGWTKNWDSRAAKSLPIWLFRSNTLNTISSRTCFTKSWDL